MEYIKLFDNHTQYETFIGGGGMLKPNVSHCIEENEVHYNPWTDPRLIITYNVVDTSQPTQLYNYRVLNGAAMFDNVEIDGVDVPIADLDTAQGAYQFATIGEHIIKYTLKNPTVIGNKAFRDCVTLTSVTLPDSVTNIGDLSFEHCSNLANINIPSGLVSIGYGAFGPPNNPLYENETLRNIILSFNEDAFAWEK